VIVDEVPTTMPEINDNQSLAMNPFASYMHNNAMKTLSKQLFEGG